MNAEAIREGYDRLARPYAEHLAGELEGKPFDRGFLDRLALDLAGRGPVCDLGCGPGHVGRYLHDRGVDVTGVDLSPGMLVEARRLHPAMTFRAGDLFALEAPEGGWAGIVAFYSIVHVPREELGRAMCSLRRALRPGGVLALAFHVGTESLRPESLWEVPVAMTWHCFTSREMADALTSAGFTVAESTERAPYEGVEHPSRRGYLRAV